MKKCFSLFLILAFILSPISQILANEKENEDDLRGIFGDKEEESEVVILNSSRERILNDFFELQDKVNKELTAESFQRLKNSAQRILNTPAIDWESASSSFLISEFENSLSQDFKKCRQGYDTLRQCRRGLYRKDRRDFQKYGRCP